jgi:hypothetical protein
MAGTVNTAFAEFLKDTVNLNADQVSKARNSRNWMLDQINAFPAKHSDFPTLYTSQHFGFGSFARSTKRQPLDDIDHLICMNANGVTYSEIGSTVYLHVPDNAYPFSTLKQTNSDYLSSIKVVNRFVKYLNEIPQYEQAEIKRNQEAAVLKMKTYPWNFDIVPCFFTTPDNQGKTFYIIPDGQGNWKKTDPRLDKERVSRVNRLRDGHVLNVIRTMKFWNSRATMATMGSYLLENMILDYYEDHSATKWVDLEVTNVLEYIKNKIYWPVYDPKGIQGDINLLTDDQRASIFSRAYDDHQRSLEAIENETSNPAYAFSKWQTIFGPSFPKYTG